MTESHLAEKLALQSESFQEGFEILSGSNNFTALIKNFENILRGTLLINHITIFYKIKPDAAWEKVSQRGIKELEGYLKNKNIFSIEYTADQKISAVITFPLCDSSVIGIILGPKMDLTTYTVYDKITLQILIQMFQSSYRYIIDQKKVKELIFGLNEKVVQLNNLVNAGIDLSRCTKEDLLCNMGLVKAASLTNASSALIEISDKNNIVRNYIFPESANTQEIKTGEFRLETNFRYKSMSFLFILSRKETRKGFTVFNEVDKILLDAISRQILAALETQNLQQQAIEKEKIEKELNLAVSIQQLIIPRVLPKIDGYDLAGINIPSREVGGDYYDCIALPGNTYALTIADVAGKGIAAALLVNTLSAALRSYLQFNLDPCELALRLNSLIYNSTTPDKYITFFIALLDLNKHEIATINAGHNPIFIVRKDKSLKQIKAGGLALGMFDFGLPYSGEIFSLDEGDSLFLYTDGIPEAMSFTEQLYSDERMTEFLLKNSELPAQDFINSIVRDVAEHAGQAEQSDDITAVYLKRVLR